MSVAPSICLPVYKAVDGSEIYAIELGKRGEERLVILVGDGLFKRQIYEQTFPWTGPLNQLLPGGQYNRIIFQFKFQYLKYLDEKRISPTDLIKPYFDNNVSEDKIQEIINRTERALAGRRPYRRDMPGLNLPVCW